MLPNTITVMDEVDGDDILLDDLVQVEVVVNVDDDDDDDDGDEVFLDEVCQMNVVISPVADVVVGDDMSDEKVPESDVQILLDVADDHLDDDGKDCVKVDVDTIVALSVLLVLLLLVVPLMLLLVKLLR